MGDVRVQYATTRDGVGIAYAETGSGYPLVFVPSVPVSHIVIESEVSSVSLAMGHDDDARRRYTRSRG